MGGEEGKGCENSEEVRWRRYGGSIVRKDKQAKPVWCTMWSCFGEVK